MMGSTSSCMEWLGVTTPLAILLSTIVAVVAIVFARKNARQQKSVDLLFSLRKEKTFVESMQALRQWRRDITDNELDKIGSLMTTKGSMDQMPEKDKELLSRARNITYVLNCFEDISIGVKHGIFDEGIIRNSIVSAFIETWDDTERSILKLREMEGNQAYYEVFEDLAKQWKKWKNRAK